MKIVIRNMVCSRCIMVVKELFEDLGWVPLSVNLGEVVVQNESVTNKRISELDEKLKALGFERIDDRRMMLIEKIKTLIVQKIHHSEHVDIKFNWSVVLSEELRYDYNYLSGLFSSVAGITLEHFIIRQKIERVKELLFYDELNMNEIADKLGYSSVQHLSTQFKKITGATPSSYKKSHSGGQIRKNLDSL